MPYDVNDRQLTWGAKLFLPSPRNSLQAHLSLFEAYQCNAIVLPAGPIFRGLLEDVLAARRMEIVEVPELDYFLEAKDTGPCPYTVPYDRGIFEPLVALQTSGSTGIPKPVVLTHAQMAAAEASKYIPTAANEQMMLNATVGKKTLNAFPFFHAAGVTIALTAFFFNQELIIPPAGPLTAEVAAALIERFGCEAASLPPSIIVDMASDPALKKILGRLKLLFTGGGPLPTDVGNEVAKITGLHSGYGSSEMGLLPSMITDEPEDWLYLKWPTQMGLELQHHSDDLYELVVVRKPELALYQPVFTMFPDLQEYRTKDLWSEHPTKQGMWRFHGRSDDIIVFSTGEKFNPGTMEDIINGHPAVKSALVCGDARFRTALLVEPAKYPAGEADKQQLIREIWNSVEEANACSPGYAKVSREFILIGTADKPFPRAGKGTVQRRMAVQLYQPELDALYAAAESSAMPLANDHPASDSSEDVTKAVRKAVAALDGFGDVEIDDNLFDRGLDSLGVLNLVRTIRSTLPGKRQLVARDVYQARTIRAIASLLTAADAAPRKPASEVMQELFERYTADLPVTVRVPEPLPEKDVVVLTGSTGSLGPYLLHELLEDASVAKIICLNRSTNAEERQKTAMQQKGLRNDFNVNSVLFLKMDISKPYFGLNLADYKELLAKTTRIVHNAWQVDFNVSLEQTAPAQVYGVRQLVDFSAMSKYGARIFFVSSIGSVARYPSSSPVPEAIMADWNVAEDGGYGQSKLLGECVLAEAASRSAVPSTICRVGQIAGPTKEQGMWPMQEWFPTIIISSKFLRCLPASLGALESVDWIPVDMMAKVFLEFAKAPPKPSDARVFHATNPHKIAWSQCVAFLETRLGIPSVPFAKWLELLGSSHQDDLAKNPAPKLLGFFNSLAESGGKGGARPGLDLSRSRQASPTLDSIGPVNNGWLELWLRQWGLI
jgi:thioester reductase-like protein